MSDFELPAGDSRKIEITVYQDDGVTPADISAATVTWAAKHRRTGTIVTRTEADGVTKVDAVNGRVDVVIAPASLMTEGLWDHELEIVDGATSSTAIQGVITVKQTIRAAT